MAGGGCGGEGQRPADSGPGADTQTPKNDGKARDGEVPFSLAAGGAGHSDVSATLSAGQVRAGRTTSVGQLLRGIKSTARVGDYKIYNSRVAFIIGDERPSSGYAPYGGELLDAARTSADSQSLLGETIFGVGTLLLKPTSVGVVSDGSDGKPAMIRVIGEPAPFSLLDSMVGGLGSAPAARLVVEYELAPDSDTLEIRWRFFNRKYFAQDVSILALGIITGDGARIFADDAGFDAESAHSQNYAATISPDIGYTVFSPEGLLQLLVVYQGISVFSAPGLELPAAGEVQRRYRFIVTDGEPEAVRRALRAARGEAEPPALTGVVRSGQTPLAGVRVHVERDEAANRYVSMTKTDKNGAYRVDLAPGSYRVTPVIEGRGVPAPVAVSMGAAPASTDLQMPEGTKLNCSVTDASGPIPAKLTVKPTTPFTQLRASFGEPAWPGGSLIRFSASGKETLDLPAGSYTVIASRGFEYEINQSSVTLAAGEQKSLAQQLIRSVKTPGAMCGDFHVHAMWSPDSDDLYEMKVSALVAEGLEIPVITEHEYIGDLNPTITKMGLQPWIRGVVGEELTTFVYGHFNPFPLTQNPDKPNQGAVNWYGKSPGTVFAEVHSTWPAAVLQVNHPRSANLGGGYFHYLGYSAALGTAKKASEWSRSFEALEVFNGSGWDANQSSTVQDWFSFLDRGFLVTATGNSDSHHAIWDHAGYPRNYVQLGADEPAKLDLSQMAKAVREGRVMVSGGPYVTASIGGKSLGDVADATAKKVTLAVTVQAPTWMPVDKLRVILGGDTVLEQTIDVTTQDPKNPAVRFQKELPVLVDRDSWVIVVVTGSSTLDPVCPGCKPFAVTNPIYLDVNGNGVYDPPKSF